MIDQINNYPDDLVVANDGVQPDVIWGNLDGREGATVAAKIDLVTQLACEEQAVNPAGWAARVAERLGGVNVNTIYDYIKVARVFRALPEAGGFGMSRNDIADHGQHRLRVFAQNVEFTTSHRDEVLRLLSEAPHGKRLGENQLRERVKMQGGEATEAFINIKLRLDHADGKILSTTFDAILLWLESQNVALPTKTDLRYGVASAFLAAQWREMDGAMNFFVKADRGS
jgi:hypothetical protein